MPRYHALSGAAMTARSGPRCGKMKRSWLGWLIDFRDRRISLLNRRNGLVCREHDGKESSVIRLGTEDGIRIGLRAIADHLEHTASMEKRSP